MMARAAIALAVLAAAAGGYAALAAGDPPLRYEVVLDNAFGLTEGADVKAAGVRVGSVEELRVDPRTARAVVTAAITDRGFGDFRRDVHCSVEPQSLIGEYFLNCRPGTGAPLAPGARIPVEQTSGTIPPDLVNQVLRRPWRERLGIILTEMGAGLAARGPDLRATIRRALPALRETDRVLAILARNRRTLAAMTRDADAVFARLTDRRSEVSRFVAEARDTAVASAERRDDLAATIRLLPEFLRRLRPVLRDLGTAARRQTPALVDLRAAADDLELLFGRLGPFARAALPAIRSLGDAADTGEQAMRAIGATVRELAGLAKLSQDPARNLRFVLEHVDDRRWAVEPNPLSPDGKGFTGLEALLQYPFVQSQAINVFDSRGYLLKLNVLPSQCSPYADAERVRENPELRKACSAALGPGPAYGIDGSGSGSGSDSDSDSDGASREPRPRDQGPPAREPERPPVPDAGPTAPAPPAQPDRADPPLAPELPQLLPDLPPAEPLPDPVDPGLLDFLLGP